ncbi:hypothetical protein THERMOT_156 [Bathymodiolus thermophilus thioautotrophic gill symbiont]|nr:hypothetical protein THERMOT_156 [Bathymodiolus thermophilus thioautotrophic gill symbiont]
MRNFAFSFLIVLDLKNIQLHNVRCISLFAPAFALLKGKILVFIRMKDLAL